MRRTSVAEGALDAEGVARLVDVLIDAEALRFGDLITKSGRPTPYFVNFGQVRTGPQLAALAACYADGVARIFGDGERDALVRRAEEDVDAVATSLALERRGISVGFAFDRKEAKDHGEGGTIVGMQPSAGDRVVILEDVTTAGTSLDASIPLLRATAGVEVVGVLVGVDRLEHAAEPTETALDGVGRRYGVRVAALATIEDVAERLIGRTIDADDVARIRAHLERYGVRTA